MLSEYGTLFCFYTNSAKLVHQYELQQKHILWDFKRYKLV